MSAISLRLPESLHGAARKLAAREGASINQLITLALAEKISALDTVDYLGGRAHHGRRDKFHRALNKIRASSPASVDRL